MPSEYCAEFVLQQKVATEVASPCVLCDAMSQYGKFTLLQSSGCRELACYRGMYECKGGIRFGNVFQGVG